MDRLEAHDLVRRDRDPQDRRKVLVTLTPTARSFGRSHLVPLAQAIRTAAAELNGPETAAVERFLRLLLDAHSSTPAPTPVQR